MLAQPRSNDALSNQPQSPCIALRRSTQQATRSPMTIPRFSHPSASPSNLDNEAFTTGHGKLTGAPGYVTTSQESLSPTKILPSKPHHVRGGSISSDMSDISDADQIIPLQPCDAEVLVPLLHRHLEMKELIEANPAHFCRLRNAIGTRTFVKCLDLWTETTRAEMSDFRWLKQTKKLIKSNDNWVLWCDVVGWDHHGLLLEGGNKSTDPNVASSPTSGSPEPRPPILQSREGSGCSNLSVEATIPESEMEE